MQEIKSTLHAYTLLVLLTEDYPSLGVKLGIKEGKRRSFLLFLKALTTRDTSSSYRNVNGERVWLPSKFLDFFNLFPDCCCYCCVTDICLVSDFDIIVIVVAADVVINWCENSYKTYVTTNLWLFRTLDFGLFTHLHLSVYPSIHLSIYLPLFICVLCFPCILVNFHVN